VKFLLPFALLLLTSCTSGPGSTPMEQDSLVILDKPHTAKILFTLDNTKTPPPELLPIFEEYKKTPLFLHIVWRTPQPPTTKDLAEFGGKKIKQFWDPKGLTPSTQGKLLINNKSVDMELLSLRMGLARAAAWPE
jgi:hypothetical protein